MNYVTWGMENAPKTMGKELTPSSGGSRTHVVPGSVRLPPPNPSKIRPAVRSRSVDPGFAGRPLEPLGYPLEPLGHEMIWDDMSHESKLDTKQSIFGSSWFPPSHAMAAMPWPIFRLGIKLLRHVRCGQWRQRLQQGLNVLLGLLPIRVLPSICGHATHEEVGGTFIARALQTWWSKIWRGP